MHAIAVDAKGTAWRGPQTIFDGRYYEAVELGWKRGVQGEGGRDLRTAYCHQNPPGLGHGHGIGFGADWEFRSHWMPFGRLRIDTRFGTVLRRLDTIELTHVLSFKRRGDVFTAALT